MSDSKEENNETAPLELEEFRDKYAGQKYVRCAAVGYNYFDFTSITRSDIDYNIHGTNFIIANAKNIKTGKIHPCYLKHANKKASIYFIADHHLWIRDSSKEQVVANSIPNHYKSGKDYDLIDVISDYKLNFNRGNAAKYVFRSGKKDDEIKDLTKAIDYLQREIQFIKQSQENEAK